MSAKRKPTGTIDPGPRATSEQAQKAFAEASEALTQIWRLNLPWAAERIRPLQLSAEGIARLAFLALDLVTEPRARRTARKHAAFSAEWQASTLPERNRAAALAKKFEYTPKQARLLARRLGLRK